MEEKTKIFIVEDDKLIARFLQITLEKANFKTAIEYNGRRAYERIMQEKFNLVLLDIRLPEMDGKEICKRVREVSDIPIIMLTAQDEISDKVEGLDLGANDYVTKPFDSEELLARIRAHVRKHNEKTRTEEITRYVVKDMIIYPERHEVTIKGKNISLTHKEFELLLYLVQNKRQVLSRDQILQRVWGYDYVGNTNVVDVYVSYLRTKISETFKHDESFKDEYIQTVRSVGYVIRD